MTNARPLTMTREGIPPARMPSAPAPTPAAQHPVLAALDHLSVAMVLASEHGTVLHANRAAGRLLAAGDGISTDSNRQMRVGLRGVAELVRRARAEQATVHAAVKRPSGARPYTITVTPLERVAAAQPAAVILIYDPQRRVRIPAGLYDLTSKERLIAEHLAHGKSIEEAAAEEKIARSTARTHLRHIFDKVGVSRQSELVAVLAAGAVFGGG